MKTKIILVCLIIIAVICSIWWDHYHELIECEKYKIEVELDRANSYKLKCIENTLLVAYTNLAPCEAHYYAYIFNDFANQYNLPWEIYPSIIRIESNFNCDIKSPSGAKGLTQVLESTAKEVAIKLGINYIENRTLWNDIDNLIIGFTYFSEGAKEQLKIDSSVNKALEYASQRYLGGPSFAKKISNNIYIGEYRATIMTEYIKLYYMFKGIEAEYKINPN